MTAQWFPDAGADAAEALCRHCGHALWQRSYGWADWNGMVVCVKAQLSAIGHGPAPQYVVHEPMPEGTRGAPLHSV
jgi:hypothetical protein